MRMMMVNEFWHGSSGRGLAGGFRALGWDVAEIDVRDYVGARFTGRLPRAAARLLRPGAVAELNRDLLRTAAELDMQVMLSVKGSFIAADTLAALQARGVVCVNFYPDVLLNHTGSSEAALRRYDLIATTKSYHLPFLTGLVGEARCAFVEHGYCPNAHARLGEPPADFRWDIGYVGNPSPYKVAQLARVAEAFSNQRIAVFGNRWGQAARGTPLARHVVGHPVMGDYFASVLRRTRVNLAMHFGPLGPNAWEDLTSTRTFEIPAAGGFMLHVDNAEVRALFEPGREVALFADAAAMIDQIRHYLAHEEERAAIAVAGQRRCVPAYSLHARAAEIASLLYHRGLIPTSTT